MTGASPELLEHLRRFEGLCRVGPDGLIYPYLCPAGIPTQGYGRVVGSLENPPITRAEAEDWLAQDAAARVKQALRLSPTPEGRRLDAIASFIFNLGQGRYKSSTLRRRVDAGDWKRAQEEMRKWVWGGGKKLPGLILRRETEALMLV